MKLNLLFLSLFATLIFSSSAQISIPLSPIKDNSIYSENNNSNGQGKLYAGNTCTPTIRRALLEYDLTVIPPGSIITNVSLILNVDNVSPNAPASSIFTLHSVNTQWGEGASSGSGQGAAAVAPDATWTDAMFGTNSWTSLGGDFTLAPSASQTLSNTTGNFTWSGAGMISDVQAWVNSPATNMGWILLGDESVNCTARRFGSSEQGTVPNLLVEYTCPSAPTAICQDYNAYLDQAGIYITQTADIDGGSTSSCGAPLSFNIINPTMSCNQTAQNANSLIISSVFDATLPGGQPKGVEIYVINNITDLSIYGLGSANNGGGTDGEEFTFPATSATAGDYIYICADPASFSTWFGFSADYTSSAVNINGDDAIELFKSGNVIDVFGDINTDGSGQPWEYMDGWANRNTNSTINSGTFNSSNWTYSGINALDGELTNASATTPIPITSFTTASNVGISTTVEVTDISNNLMSTCTAVITVLDTLNPTISCIGSSPVFNLDGTGNFTLQVSDINNGSSDNCTIDSLYLSQYNFDCSNGGVNSITLYGVDLSGNLDSCTMNIIIDASNVLTIDNVVSTNPLCVGDCDATLDITATNATLYSIDGGVNTQAGTSFSNLCAGIYSTWVSNNTGCTAEFTQTIFDPQPIIIDNIATTDVECAGDNNGEVSITANGGTGTLTYSLDGNTFGNSSLFSNLSPANYTITVQDDNGCESVANFVINDGSIIDNSITVNGTTLSANESNGQYQWIDCATNAPINGETGQLYTAVQNGNYAVIVTIGNCSDTSVCTQVNSVGLNPNTIIVELYPNPSKGHLNIKLNTSHNLVSIIDIKGKVVITKVTTSKNTMMDLSMLENGIYFVKINTDRGNITKKISLIK